MEDCAVEGFVQPDADTATLVFAGIGIAFVFGYVIAGIAGYLSDKFRK